MNRCIEQNPWAGLSSYKDPGKSEHKLIFCGRDGDTYDVTRLIDDNFFMTLYGKSGIGKTSLLNAGVFPALRREQYTPLSIRLGVLEEEIIYQDIIISEVERHVRENGGRVEEIDVIDQQKDYNATDFLWNYFARHRFLNEEGLITFPVVVLDQFEETLQKPEMRRKAEALLAQIHYIIDENHALDDCIIGDEEYVYDFNFRFVLSIREDDLYRLEDSIDNCALTALKRCRYRLRSLSEEGAREVIVKPGEGLFHEDELNLIVDSIIGIARTDKDNSISTNILSLVCNRIYVKSMAAGHDHIPFSFVEKFVKDNPFERFYNEATRDFSEREKTFIEDNLVDSTGRRNSVSEKYFLKNVPKGRKLLEGDTRILQRISASADGENVRVELIHDSFCAPLGNQKEKREARKRRRKLYYSSGLVLVFLLGIYIFIQNKALKDAIWRANETQSRFIAEKGQQFIKEGDSYLARLLALSVLPSNLSDTKDWPYTVEAECLLRNAMVSDDAILRGHAEGVISVSFSPDGNRIVSGSFDKTIRLWDSQTGKLIGSPLTGHTGAVYSVSFSPDGSRIVSGSRDKTIRLWDSQTGKQIGSPLTGHTDVVKSVSFSPDGSRIVSLSWDNTIRLWDVQTGRLISRSRRPVEIGLSSVSFSPDGKCLVIGAYNRNIYIIDLYKQFGKGLQGHTSTVYSVSYSPDGNRIVSGSDDGTIRLWDVETGKQIGEPLQGHTSAVYSVSYSPDGKHIVSGSDDGTIRLWDVETGMQIGEPLEGHLNGVKSVSFSPDGKRIISGSLDKTVRLWDVRLERQKRVFLRGSVSCFSPDGNRIVSGSHDGTIRLWDSQTGKQIGSPLTGHTGAVKSVSFSPDGSRIVSLSLDNTIRLWDSQSGKQIGSPLTGHTKSVESVSFSPDGNRIVSGSRDGTIRLWDSQTGKQIGSPLTGHTDGVKSVSFSPDGRRIVSLSLDNTFRLWDSQTGEQIGSPLTGHIAGVYTVSFSPDGSRIVSSLYDKTIRLWDSQTGKQIGSPLTGHTDYVRSVSFSPDGKRIVSGSLDGTVRIWDVLTGKQICDPLSMPGHSYDFNSVYFSPDGSRIVVSCDETLRLWSFPPLQELIDETRERFKDRELTPEERRKYYLD